jgi:arsenate reductase
MVSMKTRVLFLCTGNSCRSQMAEGLLRARGGGRFDVASAGTKPMGLNPDAVAAMAELDIDISAQQSKHVDTFAGQHFDYVISVCDHAAESCPVFSAGTRILHWSFDDPAAAPGNAGDRCTVFRRVRDDIATRIDRFLSQEGQHEAERSHGTCST